MTKKAVRRAAALSSSVRRPRVFTPPLTISYPHLLNNGHDDAFREIIYKMVQAFGRLLNCREVFGRALGLTGSQFAVLMGTAYLQRSTGTSIRALADYIHLAPTHVTTEVGRLIRKGLLFKRVNNQDRRGVLVSLSPKAEAALVKLAPFVLRVNDLLFQNVSRSTFETVFRFLDTFLLNTEQALGEIGRFERERNARSRLPFDRPSAAEKRTAH